MKKLKPVLLPGTERQYNRLLHYIDVSGKTVLVIGTGAEEIAKAIAEQDSRIFIITEEQENLVLSRYLVSDIPAVTPRLMDFDNTDFPAEKFDIVYAQASVSTNKRNKIIKEVKRVLKPGGIFCIGEVVNKTGEVPQFVKDVWTQSGIMPLHSDDISEYYKGKGFEVAAEEDLSSSLTYFYEKSSNKLKAELDQMPEEERSYNKRLLKQISHESNVYLKLGGDAYIGFKMLILRKA